MTLKFIRGSQDKDILEVKVNIIIAETDVKTLKVRETTISATIDRKEGRIILKMAILKSMTEPRSQTEVATDPIGKRDFIYKHFRDEPE